MAVAPLTCMELVELITEYLDGALAPADKDRFEAHLATCDGCTRYFEQIRMTIRMTGAIAEEQIAPDAKSALMDAFRDWKKSKS